VSQKPKQLVQTEGGGEGVNTGPLHSPAQKRGQKGRTLSHTCKGKGHKGGKPNTKKGEKKGAIQSRKNISGGPVQKGLGVKSTTTLIQNDLHKPLGEKKRVCRNWNRKGEGFSDLQGGRTRGKMGAKKRNQRLLGEKKGSKYTSHLVNLTVHGLELNITWGPTEKKTQITFQKKEKICACDKNLEDK